MNKNYFDENDNLVNVENKSLAEIYMDGAKQNRWISVKDALPEQSGVYLAYFTFKDGTHATDIAYINTGCHLGSITHWMPLPEPPKGEQK